jgi:hypothetical protein
VEIAVELQQKLKINFPDFCQKIAGLTNCYCLLFCILQGTEQKEVDIFQSI